MNCTSTRVPYRQTNAFSKIALDYIDQAAALQPFYMHAPTASGMRQAIAARQAFPNRRAVLVAQLRKQYEGVETGVKTTANIDSLLNDNTFTITTAHQNNIFTGPLYFIYKIIHAIKLADQYNAALPEFHFVPVYYIGSEDADLAELNHITIDGQTLRWNTTQIGAVGRMVIDKAFLQLIVLLEGQLSVLPHGKEILQLVKECYREETSIQQATFSFVHQLFASYGLVILLPDNAALKAEMHHIFEDDLLHQTASGIVEKTAGALEEAGYKIQANPRAINLFYLEGNIRERIEQQGAQFHVVNTDLIFSKESLLQELATHPERFSPNVILRGLYQETILPNIAFIGGGGETAYWLQLKDLFVHYNVPFPMLVLRNSFLVVEPKWKERIQKLSFQIEDFFQHGDVLLTQLVQRDSTNKTNLNGSAQEVEQVYELLRRQALSIDSTLEKHVQALKAKTMYRLQELEKKMLRAEKRKFTDQQRQIQTIREQLFPGNGLQERKDNLLYYYAQYGPDFIHVLYTHSLGLEQEFVILSLS
ncbi:MAG: bacillithiol biosynthesis cysteine-adding enzyme BshC [Bacteroidetes bacterium]|nr:bacillithiol biosynthesis cysteine-adding enzyme BshC [Bacteroidota bacterium]